MLQFRGYIMKIKYFFRLIILFLISIVFAYNAWAKLTPKQAEHWANSKGQEILRILAAPTNEQKYAALDKILAEDVDLNYAAKFAVGKYWRNMNQQQQEKYVSLFKRYAAALYKNYPLDISEGMVNFSINKVIAEKNIINVYGKIFLNANNAEFAENQGFNVLFVLAENNEHPQVRDLKVEESSLLISFRDRFYKMIHQDNDDEIDWFLEDFEASIVDAELINQHKL